MDNSVENMNQEIVLDDAVQAPEEQGEDISTVVEEPAQEEQPKEPGWIRGRIDKAVQKAEERIRAEYEAKLAPIYESMWDRQAEELVEQGEFKSLERAKEYVRMKNGSVEPVKEEEDPVMQARADLLAKQAEKLKGRGLDVMSVFNSDPDVKQRILSGEMDFYDVAETMKRTPLAPVRTPNGIGAKAIDINNMSPEQFARLQANLSGGRKYNMRK